MLESASSEIIEMRDILLVSIWPYSRNRSGTARICVCNDNMYTQVQYSLVSSSLALPSGEYKIIIEPDVINLAEFSIIYGHFNVAICGQIFVKKYRAKLKCLGQNKILFPASD